MSHFRSNGNLAFSSSHSKESLTSSHSCSRFSARSQLKPETCQDFLPTDSPVIIMLYFITILHFIIERPMDRKKLSSADSPSAQSVIDERALINWREKHRQNVCKENWGEGVRREDGGNREDG